MWLASRDARRVVFTALALVAAISGATMTARSRMAQGGVSLARMPRSIDIYSGGDNATSCHDAMNSPDACELVIDACGHGESLFDYYALHYCALGDAQWFSFILQILWLFYLFVALGVAAESFFCPALNVISTDLKLSENVAGVTLLALGNGAPDIFSTFTAAIQGSFDLAFGEVIGAGVFITTVVVGCVALLKPFKVSRRPFFRDIFFYLVALIFVMVVLQDGKLVLWEPFFLIGWYIAYVATVIIGRRIYVRMKNSKKIEGDINSDVDDSIPAIMVDNADGDLREPLLEHDRGHEAHEHVDIVRPVRVKSITAALQYATMTPEQILSSGTSVKSHLSSPIPRSRAASISAGHSLTAPDAYPDGETFADQTEWRKIVDTLFPISVAWSEHSIVDKVTGIINAPVYFLLALTVPVADVPEDPNVKAPWNRTLVALQMFVAPTILTVAMGKIDSSMGGFPVWALCLILGVAFAALVLVFTKRTVPKYYSLLAWPCFIVSVIWIYALANELVALIGTLGNLMNIDETILGITVLAWGNSVGDLIANITVARMGFGSMAVAASYAGPMLNMLIGVGMSCAYVIISSGADYPVVLNAELKVSLISLISILCFTAVIVPILKFQFNRILGGILLMLFAASTAATITISL